MRRSELARSAGCHGETVRFYEQRGLLPAPPRSAAGHRVYGREHARRLRFILRGRELGFGLDQIAQLLRLLEGGSATCADAKALALARLDETRRKLADLARLERALATMVARCEGGRRDACPVIDALSQPSSSALSGPPDELGTPRRGSSRDGRSGRRRTPARA